MNLFQWGKIGKIFKTKKKQLPFLLDRYRLKRIAEKLSSRGNVTAGYFVPPPGSVNVWTRARYFPTLFSIISASSSFPLLSSVLRIRDPVPF
jgi:hypothetical protein